MNTRLYVLLLCCGGCLNICGICVGAGEDGGQESLEQAWEALGDRPSSIPDTMMLGRTNVESFLSEKLLPQRDPADEMQNLIRMKAVVRANREKGCLWLLVQTRRHAIGGRANIVRASRGCASYAELLQFLMDELTDPSRTPVYTGRQERLGIAYDWRMCDLAYKRTATTSDAPRGIGHRCAVRSR